MDLPDLSPDTAAVQPVTLIKAQSSFSRTLRPTLVQSQLLSACGRYQANGSNNWQFPTHVLKSLLGPEYLKYI